MDIATPHAPMQVLASYKPRFSNASAADCLIFQFRPLRVLVLASHMLWVFHNDKMCPKRSPTGKVMPIFALYTKHPEVRHKCHTSGDAHKLRSYQNQTMKCIL